MKLLSLAALLVVTPVWSQEVKHAPTVEQCRADQKLWMSKLEVTSTPMPETFLELNGWIEEMMNCVTVDPQFECRYYNTAGEATSIQQ